MKTLCKLKKNELTTNFKKIIKIVKKPKFICEKCARVANDKKYLCNSIVLKSSFIYRTSRSGIGSSEYLLGSPTLSSMHRRV